jgi:hypothetical protein
MTRKQIEAAIKVNTEHILIYQNLLVKHQEMPFVCAGYSAAIFMIATRIKELEAMLEVTQMFPS